MGYLEGVRWGGMCAAVDGALAFDEAVDVADEVDGVDDDDDEVERHR